jgi:hypothetical protein
MVSFTNLLFAGSFLISTIVAHPALYLDGKVLSARSTEDKSPAGKHNVHIIKRVPSGRQLLQWSPDGTLLYIVGMTPIGLWGYQKLRRQNVPRTSPQQQHPPFRLILCTSASISLFSTLCR